jgi:hypothetical protein
VTTTASTDGATGRPPVIAVTLAILVFVAAAVTPDHYWDEYFYIFSASRHPLATLLALERPLSDGIIPNGFFSGKLGFVAMLEGLVAMTGTGQIGLAVMRSVFLLLVMGLAAASWLLLQALVDRRAALETAILLLLLPLSLYLGFKTLSETPSLLVSTLGGWQFARAVRAPAPGSRWRHVGFAAAGLGLGIVMRVTSVLFAFGLIGAVLVLRPGGATWRRIAADAAVALGIAAALSGCLYLAVVGTPFDRFVGLVASVTGRTPGPAVALYAVALFGQLFLPLVAISIWPPHGREVRAALLWLAIAMLPFLVTARYVEPRFFYTGLVPLAVMAHAGIDRVVTRVRTSSRVMAGACVLALVVLVNRLAFSALMPYELRESDYSSLIGDVRSQHPSASYVTPWLSDFCYLAVAFPEERVVLSMSRTYGTGRVFDTAEFRQWIGEQNYVGSARDLHALGEPRVYVGWEYSPTVVALDRLLRPFGFAYLDDPGRRARLLNHLTPSWIWTDPAHRLEPVATRGGYRAFAIRESGGG